MIQIRPAEPKDGPQIGQLIYETVHTVNRKDYSEKQVKAWAPDEVIFSTYEGFAYVAELERRILGFANLTPAGYLHRLYVHKEFQGQKIASRLLKVLEAKAQELGLQEITTESSITAKPFFLAQGFLVLAEQTKVLRGVSFINFKMLKRISKSSS
jgi:N-acetylglutamate synthase-like GNAT family acetyltransferase